MQPDPAERLGGPLRANELRVHPFFWGLEWTKLERRTLATPHAHVCRERAMAMTRRMGFAMAADNDSPPPSVGTTPPSAAVPTVVLPPAFALGAAGAATAAPAMAVADAAEMSAVDAIEEWPEEVDLPTQSQVDLSFAFALIE